MGNRIKEVFILQLHLTLNALRFTVKEMLYDLRFTGIGGQLKGEGG
jgi:hypothetical protein